MLPSPDKPTLATHWGTYRVQLEDGAPVSLAPYEGDPDPSPIANAMIAARTSPARVLQPAVRRSFLKNGAAAGGEGRGAEPFVDVSWDDALGLVSRELDRVRRDHGNQAIYGGSYGWASAGRFHHAQSQIHRFLNALGTELQLCRGRYDPAACDWRSARAGSRAHAVAPARRPFRPDRHVWRRLSQERAGQLRWAQLS